MKLKEILTEIVGCKPLKFKWLDEERCVFNTNKAAFGIFVEYQTLSLSTIDLSLANVSFGTIDKKFLTVEDLNTSLTNLGEPRTVFSTVAHACLANKEVVNSNLLCLAASDKARIKRALLYSLALAEIQTNSIMFKNRNTIKVQTSNGTLISILSNHLFSEHEVEEIKNELKVSKIV